MYYSAIGILALMILLIENQDIILNRSGAFDNRAWKVYRKFLFSVMIYYVTDIFWGIIEARKLSYLLFVDTSFYFIAMAAGVFYWTRYVVVYLGEDELYNKFLSAGGSIIAVAVTILSAVNIFVPVLFTVDHECVYKALPARYVILAAQIFVLYVISVHAIISMLRKKAPEDIRKRQRTLAFFGLIMATFLTIQIWFPYLPVYSIAYMLGTCLLRAIVIGDEKEEYRKKLAETIRVDEERRLAEKMHDEEVAYGRINALAGTFLAVYVVDPETDRFRVFSSNESFDAYDLAKEGEDFFNETVRKGESIVYPEDLEKFRSRFTKEHILNEVENSDRFAMTYRIVMGGRPVYVQTRAAMVEEDEVKRLIVGISDYDLIVRQEKDNERRLAQAQNLANIDALTGVKNKHAYLDEEAHLDKLIAEKVVPDFAVVIFDLNDLKSVNDTEGHNAGDKYICDACKIICDIFKKSPVFRVGGDEFAVVATGEDFAHIDELLDRMKEHNEEALNDGGIVIACGMSKHYKDEKTALVFERADHNMYENKTALKELKK